MTAYIQDTLFEPPRSTRMVELAAITRGAVLAVPAGADRARPYAYRLEVIKASGVDIVDGHEVVHVRGREPRHVGAIGRRQPFWAGLRLDLIEITEPAPQTEIESAEAPAIWSPEGEWSLPLPGPGGWSIMTNPCPACGAQCTVHGQLDPDLVDPTWTCKTCRQSGRIDRIEAAT